MTTFPPVPGFRSSKLDHRIVIIDGPNMTNLGAIPVEGARFTAIPAPIRGTGTFPIRAIAVLPGGA